MNKNLFFAKIYSLIFFATSTVQAYDFTPSQAEWLIWPEYCKAKYVQTQIGEQSEFFYAMSKDRLIADSQLISANSYIYIHHYCAGLVWLQRAKNTADKSEKEIFYRNASSEIAFTMARVDLSELLGVDILTKYAEVLEGSGYKDEAKKYYNKSIDIHPDEPLPYVSFALFLRRNGEMQYAKKILLHADEMTEGGDMDVSAVLAIVMLDTNEDENALKYAKQAYKLGYPLPGIRDRLEKKGIWEK